MTCSSCDRPLDSGTVCSNCMGTALRILGAVPGLVGELETTLTRQGRRGTVPMARSGSEEPMPYDVGAANVLRALAGILRPWLAAVMSLTHTHWEPSGLGSASRFLMTHAEVIRQQNEAGHLVSDLLDWQAEATRIVDLPPERWYAGPCDLCGNDLYALAGSVSVTCDSVGCEATYDVTARRRWLLDAVTDRLATSTEVSRALSTLKTPVTTSVIRGLVHRGRLQARGSTRPDDPDKGLPLYRVGDVIELLAARASRN